MRFLLCAMMLISFASCSDQNGKDDPDSPDFEEGIPTEVRITLSARSGNAQTRADERKQPDGTPKDPTSTIELIHNWWIVFIDKNKKIVKIIRDSDTDVYDKTTSTSVNISGGYEAETFRTILPSGTYRIYAFANIPFNTTIFGDPNKFKKGQLSNTYIIDFVPDAYKHNIIDENNGMQWPASYKNTEGEEVDNYIPMTQILKDVVISNTVEEAFNIEVVRTVAKVEFAFSNPSTDQITIKELQFGPISKGDRISIVPNNDSVGFSANNKIFEDINKNDLPDGGTDTLKFSNISLIKDRLEEDYMGKFDFYCKESIPKKDGGPFTIKLTINRNNADDDETKTLYTSKITYINRNDWIYIPIKFNNWVIKWKLHTYPPIGGYPPVFNQSGSGETLEATMTTGGEFELYPDEITQNGQKYTVDWAKDVVIKDVIDPKGILIGTPALKVNTNSQLSPVNSDKVIVGELDPKKEGDAKIRINFYLKDKDGESLDELYTCLFTIHRKNSAP